jgi:hypothetical protein
MEFPVTAREDRAMSAAAARGCSFPAAARVMAAAL